MNVGYTGSKQSSPSFQFHAVTPNTLPDLARFSMQHGKFRYCSCMRWRLTSTQFQRSTKEERVAALEGLVRQGTPVGVFAYAEGEPVGWRSIRLRSFCRCPDHRGVSGRAGLPPVHLYGIPCDLCQSRLPRRDAGGAGPAGDAVSREVRARHDPIL